MKWNHIALTTVIPMLLCARPVDAQILIPELAAFEKFVGGEWIGGVDDPKETVDIVMRFEVLLDGTAIRQVKNLPSAKQKTEKLFYWDADAKSIAYLYLTSNRYMTRGRVTLKGSVLVSEGVQYGPDGTSRQVRSEVTLNNDGTFVETLVGGHRTVFRRK